jgi:8-oxo-dGTP pyrophosphatase MutT (NUDIX family)
MYKIFINQGLLCVSSNAEDRPEEAELIQKDSFDHSELEDLLESIEEENSDIVILHPNPEKFISETLGTVMEHVTAAGGFVRNMLDQVLFIKRHGLWDLPKGKADKGESVEETALREVMEECGLSELTLKHKITASMHAYVHKGKRILKTTHWFAMYTDESDLKPQVEEDITEVEWFSEHEIEVPLENTYPLIREVVNMELDA